MFVQVVSGYDTNVPPKVIEEYENVVSLVQGLNQVHLVLRDGTRHSYDFTMTLIAKSDYKEK